MAIEIKYIVEPSVEDGYPKVFKVVLEDEIETFRVSPTLTEVHSNAPQALEEYYQAIKDFILSRVEDLPVSGLVSREVLHQIAIASNCLDDLYQKSPMVPPVEE